MAGEIRLMSQAATPWDSFNEAPAQWPGKCQGRAGRNTTSFNEAPAQWPGNAKLGGMNPTRRGFNEAPAQWPGKSC